MFGVLLNLISFLGMLAVEKTPDVIPANRELFLHASLLQRVFVIFDIFVMEH